MSKALSSILRPKSFNKMFGQDEVIKSIRSLKDKHQVWMFVGETGSGKTTIAKILARAYNCRHDITFGSFCKKCWALRKSYGIAEVNAAKYRSVEAIEPLVEMANAYPLAPALKRVIILDEAQRLSREAQDILLKPLEDPAPNTIWIICTTEAYKIAKALRGRCMILSLVPLKHRVVEDFIKWAAVKAKIKRDLDLFIEFVHQNSISSPRNILMMLEKYAAGMDPDRAAASVPSAVNTMRICKAFTAGEWGPCRAELERATGDDIRLIRAAILGYMKHQLLQRTPALTRKLIVESIETIADISYGLDDNSQLALLSARLYTLSTKYAKV